MGSGSQKAFVVLGCIGGLYGVLSGLVIMFLGVSLRGNILFLMGLSVPFPQFLEQLMTYLSTYFFSFINLISLGPLGGYYVGSIIWDLYTFGVIVAVHGFVILLSSVGAWTGNRWYAVILTVFGLMGFFAFFNFGGLLGLISGAILWEHMR
ncbi:MAG: hypothetical protein QXS27_04660 [Candidatus Jordarchaeaceae archaeon]